MEIITKYAIPAFVAIAMIMLLVWGLMMCYKILFKNDKKKNDKEQTENDNETPTDENVTYPYKLKQRVFSDKEGYFFRDVRPIADKLGLIVFTKMRIADLLEVPKNHPEFTKWFNRIKAKHIDFILVDQDYHIKMLVEVDDPSHNRPDRQARDEQVDEMFRQQGLEVLHLRAWGRQYGADDLETIINNTLNVQKTAKGNEQI